MPKTMKTAINLLSISMLIVLTMHGLSGEQNHSTYTITHESPDFQNGSRSSETLLHERWEKRRKEDTIKREEVEKKEHYGFIFMVVGSLVGLAYLLTGSQQTGTEESSKK